MGSVAPLRLEQGNLASFQSGMLLETLPKTFRDAIQITLHLRLRFLWIDSLCIIQDSPEGWLSESGDMGHVYENSLCNIVATAAPDGRGGCFRNRNPFVVQPCEVLVTEPSEVRGEGVKRKQPKAYQLISQKLWEPGVAETVLGKRAWVTQERQLSPRTIHFGEQLFWKF